jgi:Cap4 SAVED domain
MGTERTGYSPNANNEASQLNTYGEVKFYDNIHNAIKDVVAELKKHSDNNYLRNEFMLINRKIDNSWRCSKKLSKLLHANTSLDEVFDVTCIPILLTYDSSIVKKYSKIRAKYKQEIEKEIRKYYTKFKSCDLPKDLKIHLILLPLKSKNELLQSLNEELKSCQNFST